MYVQYLRDVSSFLLGKRYDSPVVFSFKSSLFPVSSKLYVRLDARRLTQHKCVRNMFRSEKKKHLVDNQV